MISHKTEPKKVLPLPPKVTEKKYTQSHSDLNLFSFARLCVLVFFSLHILLYLLRFLKKTVSQWIPMGNEFCLTELLLGLELNRKSVWGGICMFPTVHNIFCACFQRAHAVSPGTAFLVSSRVPASQSQRILQSLANGTLAYNKLWAPDIFEQVCPPVFDRTFYKTNFEPFVPGCRPYLGLT